MTNLAKWTRTIVNEAGDVQPGATITVRDRLAGNDIANIYSDRAGATPMANPFTSDSNGLAAFFAPGSAYQITAVKSPFTTIWDYVGIGTASESDTQDLLIGVNFIGEWATATIYAINDETTHNGSTFICILGHTSGSTTEPGVGASWATNWSFIAKRGDDAPKWLFNTAVTNADPGTGKFKFNNATLASVTALYISESGSEYGNPDYSAWLATLPIGKNTTNRGYLTFRSILNPGKYAIFKIGTNATPKAASVFVDNGTWDTIVVAYLTAAGGLFAANEEVGVTFTRNGDPGKVGISQTYDASSTTTNADPGAGLFRVNNATVASITQIAVDNLTVDGLDVSAAIALWNLSTSQYKGYLTCVRADNGAEQFSVIVGSVVAQSGYLQVNCAYMSGVLPTDGSICNFIFSQKGDAGPSDFRQIYDSSSVVMGDPGSGLFRTNNAMLASVTALALDDNSLDGVAIDAFINTFDDSTNVIKGFLTVSRQDNPANFFTFAINSLADNTGWTQLNGILIASNGPLTNGFNYVFSFSRAGDAGLSAPRINWDNTSNAMADPGAGKFRYDSATLASVANIAISATDADGSSILGFVNNFRAASSVVKGYLELIQQNAPAKRGIFQITSVTDNTTWLQIGVTYLTAVAFDTPTATLAVPVSLNYYRTGDRGNPSGLRYAYDGTITMADPTTGKFRLNNAALASVTALAISYTNSENGNPDSSAFVKTWDDSTTPVKGLLTIVDVNAPQNFAQYNVTGTITDNTTWLQLTLAYVGSAGTFVGTRNYSFAFDRTGDIGQPAGLHYTFDTTTTMAAPASGALRLNNATLASVTAAAISNLLADPSNPDVSAFTSTWDDSTTTTLRGFLTIKKKNAPQNFAVYAITGANVDNSGWKQLALTYITAAGSLSAADDLALEFTRTGNVGSPTVDIPIVIGDGVNPIGTGNQGFVLGPFSFSCTLTGNTILAKQSGSISIDVLKCTYAQYDAGSTHPVAGDKISASAPIAIAAATKNQDNTLTGWTVAIAIGDMIELRPSSVTTITQATVTLKGNKTS